MSARPLNNSPEELARPETLVQSTINAVIEHIRHHTLKAQDKLPSEATFIKELGVSRTVVREAFKSLAAMRIIEMSAGRRAQVGAFDDSVMALTLTHALRTDQINEQQVWDARRAIELRTVELAAMHRSDEEVKALIELVECMRDSFDDLAVMTEYDIAFHVAIAQATRNPLFPVLVASLTGAMRETNPIVWRCRKTKKERLEVISKHEDIALAIQQRDSTAAISALEKHFDIASSGLLKAGFN